MSRDLGTATSASLYLHGPEAFQLCRAQPGGVGIHDVLRQSPVPYKPKLGNTIPLRDPADVKMPDLQKLEANASQEGAGDLRNLDLAMFELYRPSKKRSTPPAGGCKGLFVKPFEMLRNVHVPEHRSDTCT